MLGRAENQLFLSAIADYPDAVRVTLSLANIAEVKEQTDYPSYADELDTCAIYPNELSWTASWSIEWYETNLRNESIGEDWAIINPADGGPHWYYYPHVRRHTPNFNKDKTS